MGIKGRTEKCYTSSLDVGKESKSLIKGKIEHFDMYKRGRDSLMDLQRGGHS